MPQGAAIDPPPTHISLRFALRLDTVFNHTEYRKASSEVGAKQNMRAYADVSPQAQDRVPLGNSEILHVWTYSLENGESSAGITCHLSKSLREISITSISNKVDKIQPLKVREYHHGGKQSIVIGRSGSNPIGLIRFLHDHGIGPSREASALQTASARHTVVFGENSSNHLHWRRGIWLVLCIQAAAVISEVPSDHVREEPGYLRYLVGK